MPTQDIADQIASHLTEGRYDRLTEHYRYPLPVSHVRGFSLVSTPQQIWAFYQGLHASLRANDLPRVSAQVTAEELPVRDRFRVWTDWTGHAKDGRAHCFARTICYKQDCKPLPKIHMLEFLNLELPTFQPFS
jgi:hypothetical protein